MIPISSYLSNLPNQAINRIMWPSYLKSHEKMLLNDTHIILFEQPTQSGNILSHVTTTLRVCGSIDAIKGLIWAVKRSWWVTCLIEPVIPPHQMHTCQIRPLHLGTIFRLFETSSRMNLRPLRPCAVIKGIMWLKIIQPWFGNCFLCTGAHPKAPLYSYFLHHNFLHQETGGKMT